MKKIIFSFVMFVVLISSVFAQNEQNSTFQKTVSQLAITATTSNIFNQVNCGERPVHNFNLSVSAMDKNFQYGVRGLIRLNGDGVWIMGGMTYAPGKSFQFSPMLGVGKYFWDVHGNQNYKVTAGAQLWTNYGSKNFIETSITTITSFGEIDLFEGRTMMRIMNSISVGIGVLKEMDLQWSTGPLVSFNARPVDQVMLKLDLGYMMTKGIGEFDGKLEGRPQVNFTVKFTPF